MYTATILCNKYVLTSLGFHYPTVFQTWQTCVGLILMHFVAGYQLKNVILREIIPWIPAMFLYVGTIYSGSIALSQLPIPVFILGQSCSDVVLLLCNQMMPSLIVHFSFPLKLAAAIVASWSVLDKTRYMALVWLIFHCLFSGIYRSICFWYATPHWPNANLSISQRQYLNYVFALAILLPLMFLLGHHEEVMTFEHLKTNQFFFGCFCSGVFSWAVNKIWTRICYQGVSESKTLLTQTLAKVITLLLSMKIYPKPYSWSLWIGILLGISSDVLHIIDVSYETNEPSPSEEMHDVLISI